MDTRQLPDQHPDRADAPTPSSPATTAAPAEHRNPTEQAEATAQVRAARPHRRGIRRAWIAAAVAGSLVIGGGAYWAADRYLIPHVEIANASALEASSGSGSGTGSGTGSGESTTAETSLTSNSYTSGDTSITIDQRTTGSGDDTVTYYVADVTLGDASELRSAFANDQFGENITEKTSEIAEDNDAVFAINGDYYGFRDTGIVIRNGTIYRDEGAREGLALYADGSAKIYDETETTAQQLVDDGVLNTLSFGPALLEGGEVVDGIDDVEVDTNFGNHSIQGEQPRTAIGVIDDNHLVFVVVDGRDDGYSRGVTMTELAEIMQDLGAETAYNLDGGGSSTMVFDGAVVNQPSNGGERSTSDILYVGGAER